MNLRSEISNGTLTPALSLGKGEGEDFAHVWQALKIENLKSRTGESGIPPGCWGGWVGLHSGGIVAVLLDPRLLSGKPSACGDRDQVVQAFVFDGASQGLGENVQIRVAPGRVETGGATGRVLVAPWQDRCWEQPFLGWNGMSVLPRCDYFWRSSG